MSNAPLSAIAVDLTSPIFRAISGWPFEDEFVVRILSQDIPQRLVFENARFWGYRDPQNTIVGFGTLSICADYRQFTGNKFHTYIPLLAVHPGMRGRGYGKTIVDHLIEEAACMVRSEPKHLHNSVFLDVYERSAAALRLYQKCGFASLGERSFIDPANGETYRIMIRRLSP